MQLKSWALVTGASQGIGEQIARVLAGRGYCLILTARSAEKLKTLASELTARQGIDCLTFSCDLSSREGAIRLLSFIEESGKPIEVLVNNAGFGLLTEFGETDWSVFSQMLELNLFSLTHLTHFFVKRFRTSGKGFILNVASTAAFQPVPFFSVYGASKSYVLSFSEAIREELKDSGIQVSVLCPGPVDTPFHERAGTNDLQFFKWILLQSKDVAKRGVSGLFNGKAVIVPGVFNQLLALSNRIFPRFMVRKITGRLFRLGPRT